MLSAILIDGKRTDLSNKFYKPSNFFYILLNYIFSFFGSLYPFFKTGFDLTLFLLYPIIYIIIYFVLRYSLYIISHILFRKMRKSSVDINEFLAIMFEKNVSYFNKAAKYQYKVHEKY